MPLNPIDRADRRAKVLGKFYDDTQITRTEPGAIGRAAMEGVLSELEAIEDRSEQNLSNAMPTQAESAHLELWMDYYGLDRETATHAHVLAEDQGFRFFVETGTFGDINNGQDIVIARNEVAISGVTKIAADEGIEEFPIEYELLEESVTLAAGDSEQFVGVRAVQPGTFSNIGPTDLNSHDYTNYTTYPDVKLLCQNTIPIVNGEEEEDSDRMRYRLSRRGAIRPLDTLEQLQVELDAIPGVNEVMTIKNAGGIGTVDIYIDSQSFVVPDSLISLAAERAGVILHPDNLNIEAMPRVGIAIDTKVYFKSGVSKESRASILEALEAAFFNMVLAHTRGLDFDLEKKYNQLALTFAEVGWIGYNGNGFDKVIIYRDSLGGQRAGSTLSDTLSVIPMVQYERLLPEDSLSRPISFTEGN